MTITIQFSHLVLFIKRGNRLQVVLPREGHGAVASVDRGGVTTALTVPDRLRLEAVAAPGESPEPLGTLTVSSYRLPDFGRFIQAGPAESLSISDRVPMNCVVDLEGGTLVGSEPTFDDPADQVYADDRWQFDNNYTTQLTNHSQYVIANRGTLVLRDGAGRVWHSFEHGDFLRISNMDPHDPGQGAHVHNGKVELTEFRHLYDLVSGKASVPANPTTPLKPTKQHIETPEKPMCSNAFIELS